MTMSIICDYAVPRKDDDKERTTSMLVPTNQRDLTFDFTLPPGAQRDRKAIVSFMLHTTDADDLQFQVQIGSHMKNYTVNSEVMRAVHEIIGPNALNVVQLEYNSLT